MVMRWFCMEKTLLRWALQNFCNWLCNHWKGMELQHVTFVMKIYKTGVYLNLNFIRLRFSAISANFDVFIEQYLNGISQIYSLGSPRWNHHSQPLSARTSSSKMELSPSSMSPSSFPFCTHLLQFGTGKFLGENFLLRNITFFRKKRSVN